MHESLALVNEKRSTMALSRLLPTSSSLPDLPPEPNHPSSQFVFPKREFGKKQIVKRSCQRSWFSTWPWLHYQVSDPEDVVFCHVCVSALKSKRMEQSRGDPSFTRKGFMIGRMPLSVLRIMKHLQVTKKPCR